MKINSVTMRLLIKHLFPFSHLFSPGVQRGATSLADIQSIFIEIDQLAKIPITVPP